MIRRIMRMCHFRNQDKPFTSQDNFFGMTKNNCNFYVYSNASFLSQKWSISLNMTFFREKNINIILIYLLVPIIVKNFKNTLRVDA